MPEGRRPRPGKAVLKSFRSTGSTRGPYCSASAGCSPGSSPQVQYQRQILTIVILFQYDIRKLYCMLLVSLSFTHSLTHSGPLRMGLSVCKTYGLLDRSRTG